VTGVPLVRAGSHSGRGRNDGANDGDRYVQPNKQRGGWDVVKEDHKRVSVHTRTQAEAISAARRIVRDAGGGELRIKNEKGS
jgi:Uncharacterized protein conserved in bacteria (DUF2188)